MVFKEIRDPFVFQQLKVHEKQFENLRIALDVMHDTYVECMNEISKLKAELDIIKFNLKAEKIDGR